MSRIIPLLSVLSGLSANLIATPAAAHTSERGFILLLPTEYYLAGGTIAVAATLVLLAALRPETGTASRGTVSFHWPGRWIDTAISALSFGLFIFLVYCGIAGARDPLTNPLPLAVWTIGWIGVTTLHAVVGNIWSVLHPWRFPVRCVRVLAGHPAEGPGPVALPKGLAFWPAIVLFMGIAWYELVDPAPDDPDRLAVAVSVYWLVGLAGALVFGEKEWLRTGEPLTVLFRFLSLLAPFSTRATPSGRRLEIGWPGRRIGTEDRPPLPAVLFILLTLATVSFDGLNMTFWWLGLHGINPLEFPGRSAVVGINTAGLIGAWTGLAGLYACAAILGDRFGGGGDAMRAVRGLVLSILPISLAYHVSHYLTVFLVNGQWALVAANDPLALGWDLFGLADLRVTTSFLNVSEDVEAIWRFQVAVIVIGHVWAVLLAHGASLSLYTDRRRAVRSQIPMGALMVGYTLFGLWLLSSPTGG